jgi:hypothetical protein
MRLLVIKVNIELEFRPCGALKDALLNFLCPRMRNLENSVCVIGLEETYLLCKTY